MLDSSNDSLPKRYSLPWYVAPVPRVVEDWGLRLAWVIVLINLAGTAFGFWYYLPQFGREPIVMWPFVPDSPSATLFIALSIAAWKVGRNQEWLNALAFYGCIKLGVWTPYVLLVFKTDFSYLHPLMYNFLFWSHLAMVVEAFVLYRYSDFPVWAVGIATVWYGLNDVVDYFVPVVGDPHHTSIPAEITSTGISHNLPAHDIAAVGAVVLTTSATFLALSTRVKKLEAREET
ncbi:MAG: DUF1405 domain-containing protein [Halobacteria archaeon]|nr:DUF1405 domain-containing protein [Halobacteria archaeon]